MSVSLLLSVITGKLTALTPGPSGSMQATVSLIKAYKTGSLTISQAGETKSVKLVMPCKKCPLLRRGKYITVSDSLDFIQRSFLTYQPIIDLSSLQ